MKHSFILILLFILSKVLFAQSAEFEPGQLYFKYENTQLEFSQEQLNFQLMSRYNGAVIAKKAFVYSDYRLDRIFLIEFDTNLVVADLIRSLQNFKGCEYVERIGKNTFFYTPNDLGSGQYGLDIINAKQAWDLTKGDSDIVIAVVDDAVLLTHADLAPNIWTNVNEIAGNGIDDDLNGYIDDVNGWDVADNDNDVNPVSTATNKYHSHGTHCAGIVSAKSDNGIGIASLGFNLKIMPVKIGGERIFPKPPYPLYIRLINAYRGVEYAIYNGANVISMSWGREGPPSATEQTLLDIAYSKNIVCVAAANNYDTNLIYYPAAYDHVINVASSNSKDFRSSFSNYGSTIDVSAPGTGIYSTVPGLLKYDYKDGTSMACPLVSALCGLMLSVNPVLTVDEIESCLKSTCDTIYATDPKYLGKMGAGRVNAYNALRCIRPINPVFNSSRQQICPGQSITFTDSSFKDPTKWKWSFPGGTPSTDTVQNPTIVYNTPGCV